MILRLKSPAQIVHLAYKRISILPLTLVDQQAVDLEFVAILNIFRQHYLPQDHHPQLTFPRHFQINSIQSDYFGVWRKSAFPKKMG